MIVSEPYQSWTMSVIGVPVKVLHEAEGHIVTIETTSGEVGLVLYILHYDLDSMILTSAQFRFIEAS